MTKLVVDMTPTVVNRTAIYHIARDTLAALPADTAIQYRGQIARQVVEDNPERQQIADAFFRDLGVFLGQHIHTDEIHPQPAGPDRTPRLFFDPLYTLYKPLLAGDVVFVLDMSTLTNREWHEPHIVRLYERAFRRLAASRAKVVSISHNTTAGLRATFSIAKSSITTVPLYVRPMKAVQAQAPDAPLEPGRFLLFVGSLEARKNVVGLIEAFAMSGLHARGYRLAIAGGDGRGAEEIRATAEVTQGVDLLGFVSEGELRWLYENAAAFTYPSHLEGFGVPLLEAMSFGLPCLSPTTGAPPEITQGLCPTADPSELMSIVQGLNQVVEIASGDSDAIRSKLRQRAATFTFQRYMGELSKALPCQGGDL